MRLTQHDLDTIRRGPTPAGLARPAVTKVNLCLPRDAWEGMHALGEVQGLPAAALAR